MSSFYEYGSRVISLDMAFWFHFLFLSAFFVLSTVIVSGGKFASICVIVSFTAGVLYFFGGFYQFSLYLWNEAI